MQFVPGTHARVHPTRGWCWYCGEVAGVSVLVQRRYCQFRRYLVNKIWGNIGVPLAFVVGTGFVTTSQLAWAGKQAGESSTYQREMGMEMQVSYVAAGNGIGLEEYIGIAFPGTDPTSPNWQIYRLTYDSSHRVATRCWADGSDAYDKTWADRATYPYC